MNLKRLSDHWNAYGQRDPLWAILTVPGTEGGRWDEDAFFRTGVDEIEGVLAYVRSLGRPLPAGRALDFGCGVGRLTQALAVHFDEVHGVDIATSMIERARRYNRHGERCQHLVNATDRLECYPDDFFAFAYTNIVLQHIPPEYTKRYIADFMRVLAPGGLLIFQLPTHQRTDEWGHAGPGLKPRIWSVVPPILRRGYRSLRRALEFPRMEGHGIAREEVVALLAASGARVLDIVEDASAGPQWAGLRYCATKDPRR